MRRSITELNFVSGFITIHLTLYQRIMSCPESDLLLINYQILLASILNNYPNT